MKSIKDHIGKYSNVAQLLEFIGSSPEERNLVALLAVDKIETENEKIILEDCIQALEREQIKKQVLDLRNEIKLIEESGKLAPETLVNKLVSLQRSLS
tara:strand:+ start:969 stop:1262 length:294 start_codon:yes stop_codon:yes gene_type:complete